MSTIPQAQRAAVKKRFRERCTRCGMAAPSGHWHHRRTRRIEDLHTHCTCNGVWLCTTCHEWVHAHPFEARGAGLIVSRYTTSPGGVPLATYLGSLHLSCDGLYNFTGFPTETGTKEQP